MGFCLILTAAGLGWFVTQAPEVDDVTEASFVIQPPTVDPNRLAQARAKHYPEVDLSIVAEPLDELYEVSRQANEMQFGSADAKTAHDNQVVMAHAANAVITKVGIEGFVPAGQKMFDECASAFDKLLGAIQAGSVTVEQARTDPGDAHQSYRSMCGNALGPLIDSGVVTKEGKWADPVSGPHVFDIMNRFRWAATLDLRKPPSQQLAPYEYEVLTLWRASISNVPPAKRIQWVVSAGRVLPKFETAELIGSLLLEQGDATGALGAYEEACAARKRDVLLQRKCEFLRANVPVRGAAPSDPHAASGH